jgi:hypothetical protein
MSKEQPMVLMMKHDEAQVRELRLVADVLNEQVQASTVLGALLLRAAERIEWLSACASSNDAARRDLEKAKVNGSPDPIGGRG